MPVDNALMPYSAIILGATGNVGRQIVSELAANPQVRQVVIVNRRSTDQFAALAKVRETVVPDMNNLAQATEAAAREAGTTLGICAIGVGKGSRKMAAEEVRRIEVQYPAAFASGCKAAGVLSFGLMTAVGANSKSSFSYVRIIGDKEQAVIDVGLSALGIYRPSVIFGNSNTPSYLHYLYPVAQSLLPSRYHAIRVSELARAMVVGTRRALAEQQQKSKSAGVAPPAVKFYEYRGMKALFTQR